VYPKSLTALTKNTKSALSKEVVAFLFVWHGEARDERLQNEFLYQVTMRRIVNLEENRLHLLDRSTKTLTLYGISKTILVVLHHSALNSLGALTSFKAV